MHRMDSKDESSVHPDILSDNIHDAPSGSPGCCNRAAGVQKQFACLGMPSPFSRCGIRNVDHPGSARRKVQPRGGFGRVFQIHPGQQYVRPVLRADLPG